MCTSMCLHVHEHVFAFARACVCTCMHLHVNVRACAHVCVVCVFVYNKVGVSFFMVKCCNYQWNALVELAMAL